MSAQSIAPLLIITPDDAQIQTVSNRHPLLFSRHFNLICDKLGLMAYEIQSPEILNNPTRCHSHAVILVLGIPLIEWRPAYTDTLRHFPGKVILEGPVPPELFSLAGILPTSANVQQSFNRLWLQVIDENMRLSLQGLDVSEIDPSLSNVTSKRDDPTHIPIAYPACQLARPVQIPEQALTQTQSRYFQLLRIYCYIQERKAFPIRRFGKHLFNDLMVLYGTHACGLPVNHYEHLAPMTELLDAWQTEKTEQPLNHLELGLLDALISSLAPSDTRHALTTLRSTLLSSCLSDSQTEPSFWTDWAERTLRDLERTLDKPNLHLFGRQPRFPWLPFRRKKASQSPIYLSQGLLRNVWVLLARHPQTRTPALQRFIRTIKRLEANIPDILPGMFGDQPDIASYILFAGICQHLGLGQVAERVSLWTLDTFQDPVTCLLWRNQRHERWELSGWAFLLLAVLAQTLPVSAPPTLDENRFGRQVQEPLPCLFQTVSVSNDTAVLISAHEPEAPSSLYSTYPAWIQHNHVHTTLLPLFSYLAAYQAIPAMTGAFLTMKQSEFTYRLETLCKNMLIQLQTKQQVPVPIIASWPDDQPFCVTIRRDVDRPVDSADFERLLAQDAEQGLQGSWYWLSSNLHPEQIRQLEASGQEVGWHAERWMHSGDTPTALQKLAPASTPMGATIHGGVSSDGWQGANTLQAYQTHQMLYGDSPGTLSFLPSQALLWTEGGLQTADMTICPVSFSYEQDANTPLADKVMSGLAMAKALGGQFILLHHPDLLNSAVLEILRKIGAERPFVAMTMRQAASWWRLTHRQDHLRMTLESVEPAVWKISVHSREEITGLVVRIMLPAETWSEKPVNLDNTGNRYIAWHVSDWIQTQTGYEAYQIFQFTESRTTGATGTTGIPSSFSN